MGVVCVGKMAISRLCCMGTAGAGTAATTRGSSVAEWLDDDSNGAAEATGNGDDVKAAKVEPLPPTPRQVMAVLVSLTMAVLVSLTWLCAAWRVKAAETHAG